MATEKQIEELLLWRVYNPIPTTKECVEILKSDFCYCKKRKDVKKVFCIDCFLSLPAELQRALYQKIGDGFADAVNISMFYLWKKAAGHKVARRAKPLQQTMFKNRNSGVSERAAEGMKKRS